MLLFSNFEKNNSYSQDFFFQKIIIHILNSDSLIKEFTTLREPEFTKVWSTLMSNYLALTSSDKHVMQNLLNLIYPLVCTNKIYLKHILK